MPDLVYPVDLLDQAWVTLLRSDVMDAMNDASIEMLAKAGYYSMYRLENIKDTAQVNTIFERMRKEAFKAVQTAPTGEVAAAAVPAVAPPPVGIVTRAVAAAQAAAATAAAANAILANVQAVTLAVVPDRDPPTFSNVMSIRFAVLVSWFHRMDRLGIVPYSQSFTAPVYQIAAVLHDTEHALLGRPPAPGNSPAVLTQLVKFVSWKKDFTRYARSIYGAALIPLSYIYRDDAEESAEAFAADAYATMDERLAARTRLNGAHYDRDNRTLALLLDNYVQAPTILPHVERYIRHQDGRGAMLALQNASQGAAPKETLYQQAADSLHKLVYEGHTKQRPFDLFVTQFIGLTNDCATHGHEKLPHDMVADFMSKVQCDDFRSAFDHINRHPELRNTFEATLKVFTDTNITIKKFRKTPASNVSEVNSGKRKRGGGKGGGKPGAITGRRQTHSVGEPWTLPITGEKYPKEVWIRLTQEQQDKKRSLTPASDKGKKGGAGGTKARGILAVTTQPIATSCETAEHQAPIKKKRKVGPARKRRNDLRTAAHQARNLPPVEPIISVVSTADAMEDDDDSLSGVGATADVPSVAGLPDNTDEELEDFDDLEVSDDELVTMQPGQPAVRFVASVVCTSSSAPPIVMAPYVRPLAGAALAAPLPVPDPTGYINPAIDLSLPPLPGYNPPGIDADGYKYPSRPWQWTPTNLLVPPNHQWDDPEHRDHFKGVEQDGKFVVGRGFACEPVWAMHRDGTFWDSAGFPKWVPLTRYPEAWTSIHGHEALAAKARAVLELEGPPQKATAAEIAAFNLVKDTYPTKPFLPRGPTFGRQSHVRSHTLKSSSDQSM